MQTRQWRSHGHAPVARDRLVDGLAELDAQSRRAPKETLKLLASAEATVLHHGALLARVTHEANNHMMDVVDQDGTKVPTVCRDAQLRPARKTGTIGRVKAKAVPKKPTPFPDVRPWSEATHSTPRPESSTSSNSRLRTETLRSTEEWQLNRRVVEIGANLKPNRTGEAQTRMEELTQRDRSQRHRL